MVNVIPNSKGFRLSSIDVEKLCFLYQSENITIVDISKRFGITKTAVKGLLERRNITIRNDKSKLKRKYTLDESVFDIIDSQEKSYLLGLLFADGNNDGHTEISIQLSEVDITILEKFREFFKTDRPLEFISKKNNKQHNQYRLRINSRHICDKLTKYGCTKNKSLTLKFPTCIPSEFIHHFIRGYFDGDGCISINKNNYLQFSIVGTKEFIGSVADIFIENISDLRIKIYFDKRGSGVYSLFVNGNSSIRVFDYLYNNSNIYIGRKYNKFLLVK